MSEVIDVPEIFGEDVFNDTVMRDHLPKEVYEDLKKTIREGTELKRETADVVAAAMKDWAVEKGATHYTHWFQPLTGVTAEKHDSFITPPDENGKTLMEFSGKELIKGEPDASSFPSGGLRATFEARGYTAWDCTSPAFLKHDAAGTILCIPTAFCSYTGEALDKKTPLLRSMEAIDKQSIRLLRLMGNTTSKKVTPSVGAEQEYFLISRENYLKRKDLVYTGRTLFGGMPSKGQEMEDHYFGSIPESLGAFMNDLNVRLWKLGITATTQHNEVAPAQHELAPIYAEANVASDQNQLIMESMKKVAYNHDLCCLLHEKPFEGVNGSGKHINWSLVTDDGINLMNPGRKVNENTLFLLILSCVVRAVDKHADLLRLSASDVGNDQRLGKQEAPPAIISMFLGDQLDDVLRQLLESGEAKRLLKGSELDTGVSSLPKISKDATDRNRTSPFAFTGNKFEFRMCGSSDSISSVVTVLNTIVAEAFSDACDVIEKAESRDEAVKTVILHNLHHHYRVIFNGDGYSQEWIEEAEKRGLPNLPSMVDAIPSMLKPENVEMFEKFRVYSETELKANADIRYDTYVKTINIEAKTMVNMAEKAIIPACVQYVGQLGDSLTSVKNACPEADTSVQKDLLMRSSRLLAEAETAMKELEDIANESIEEEDLVKKARKFHDDVMPAMEALRDPVDQLEFIVDKKLWPYPSYGDMMFEVK